MAGVTDTPLLAWLKILPSNSIFIRLRDCCGGLIESFLHPCTTIEMQKKKVEKFLIFTFNYLIKKRGCVKKRIPVK
jgi:hypothetical protein